MAATIRAEHDNIDILRPLPSGDICLGRFGQQQRLLDVAFYAAGYWKKIQRIE